MGLRSDQLIERMRQQIYIGDHVSYPEWTVAKLLRELNDKQRSVFSDIVVKARAGFWLQNQSFTTTASGMVRIPPRSVVQGLESVEVLSSSTYVKLREVSQEIARGFQSLSGTPEAYWVNGDKIVLLPNPGAGATIRVYYYIRPSELVVSQSSTQGGDAADRGRVTGVNTSTRVITVNALPFDQSLTTPAAITTAVQTIDVVHPDGWAELALVGASQTFSGLNITVGGTQDLSEIQVGDYVRVAGQTDWPQLPEDYHRLLADIASVKVMIALSMEDKALTLSQSNSPDLERFRSSLTPRTKSSPKRIPLKPYGYR